MPTLGQPWKKFKCMTDMLREKRKWKSFKMTTKITKDNENVEEKQQEQEQQIENTQEYGSY